MATSTLTVRVCLPWYWRGYLWAAYVARAVGIEVEPEDVAAAIVNRIKVKAVK